MALFFTWNRQHVHIFNKKNQRIWKYTKVKHPSWLLSPAAGQGAHGLSLLTACAGGGSAGRSDELATPWRPGASGRNRASSRRKKRATARTRAAGGWWEWETGSWYLYVQLWAWAANFALGFFWSVCWIKFIPFSYPSGWNLIYLLAYEIVNILNICIM